MKHVGLPGRKHCLNAVIFAEFLVGIVSWYFALLLLVNTSQVHHWKSINYLSVESFWKYYMWKPDVFVTPGGSHKIIAQKIYTVKWEWSIN